MRLLLPGVFLAICGLVVACAETAQPAPFDGSGNVQLHGDDDDDSSSSTSASTKSSTQPAPTGSGRTTGSTPTVPVTPPSTPDAEMWMGTLAQTSPVDFGGTDGTVTYCSYQEHLENITVRLVRNADGSLVSADVSGTSIENYLGTCGSNQPLIPSNVHDYSAPTANGTSFIATNADGNQPPAQVNAQIDGSNVILTFHRTDIDAPFNWTVTATVPITKQ